MSERICELEDYRLAQQQALSANGDIKVVNSFVNKKHCPLECPGILEIVQKGRFPKTTLECPTSGAQVQLGRFATFVRQIIVE